MSKNINAVIDISKMSPEQLEAHMKAIQENTQNQLAAIKEALKTQKTKQVEVLNVEIEGYRAKLSKVLKREVSLADFANMVRAAAKGTLGFNSSESENVGNRGNRLADADKPKLKADMLKRAVDLKLGRVPEQVSVIAARYNVGDQTAAKYKPTQDHGATQAELDAAIAAATPAPVATETPAAVTA